VAGTHVDSKTTTCAKKEEKPEQKSDAKNQIQPVW